MKKLIFLFVLIFTIAGKNQVYAQTILGNNMGDTVRFMYFLINGPPNNTWPSGFDGPEGGFLGMIRQITGPDALGGGLRSGGYTTCSSIPSSGTVSLTDSEGTFVMTMSSSVMTIPTGYTGAGSNFDKRVSVTFDSTKFMDIEFNCDTNVGWLRFADTQNISGGSTATSRHIEVFWDTESASATKMELAMYYENTSNEYFRAKFQTSSASEFEIWITRYATDGGNNGFRAAIHGDTSSNLANVFFLFKNTGNGDTSTGHADGGDVTGAGDLQCINFSDGDNPVDATGSCGSLAIASPGTPIIDSDGDFSINKVGDTAQLKAGMTSL